MERRKTLAVYEGMTGITGMMENAFTNVKSHLKSIIAEIEIPREGPRVL